MGGTRDGAPKGTPSVCESNSIDQPEPELRSSAGKLPAPLGKQNIHPAGMVDNALRGMPAMDVMPEFPNLLENTDSTVEGAQVSVETPESQCRSQRGETLPPFPPMLDRLRRELTHKQAQLMQEQFSALFQQVSDVSSRVQELAHAQSATVSMLDSVKAEQNAALQCFREEMVELFHLEQQKIVRNICNTIAQDKESTKGDMLQLAERVGAISGLLTKEGDARIGDKLVNERKIQQFKEDANRQIEELLAKFEDCKEECKLSSRLEDIVRSAVSKEAATEGKVVGFDVPATQRGTARSSPTPLPRAPAVTAYTTPPHTFGTATFGIPTYIGVPEPVSSPPRPRSLSPKPDPLQLADRTSLTKRSPSPQGDPPLSADTAALTKHSEYSAVERKTSDEHTGLDKLRLADRCASPTLRTVAANMSNMSSLRSLPGHSSLLTESRWASARAPVGPVHSIVQIPDTTVVCERPQVTTATTVVPSATPVVPSAGSPIVPSAGLGRAASPPAKAVASVGNFPRGMSMKALRPSASGSVAIPQLAKRQVSTASSRMSF